MKQLSEVKDIFELACEILVLISSTTTVMGI